MVDCTLPGYTTRFMIEQSSERPIEQTPENYRELQAMVFYADPLFIGRNGAWLSSQAVLLAIAVAQFKQVPAAMVLTLAVSGVLISVFWFFAAKSLADRITWLDNELGRFEGSIHARYLADRRSAASPALGVSDHDHRPSDDARGRLDAAGHYQVLALNGHGRKRVSSEPERRRLRAPPVRFGHFGKPPEARPTSPRNC